MKDTLLFILFSCLAINSFSQTNAREEFNGPFASWANVKTRFHAKGDGVTDDTRAIQTALDSLTTTNKRPFNDKTPSKYVVVYLPSGTYKISQTLTLAGKIGVTFVGQDPLTTTIKWYGANNDTMFYSNRSAYIKVSRITWDANNKQNMEILGLHYKDFIEPNFAPTSIEFSDMIFTGNPKFGISAGSYGTDGTGMMDAEVAIKRCKFNSCQYAGILIKGYNALDYWIWDCEFNSCNSGVDCSHGNYHIYQSHFNNSLSADINIKDAIYTSVRGCYSNNSKAFSVDAGASCNAFKRIFQGNFVRGCKSIPIQYHHQGKISLVDNYFLNDSSIHKSVDFTSWCKGNYDVLSIDNSFTEASADNYNLRKDFKSALHSIDDKKINIKEKKLPEIKLLQPFLPDGKRVTFDVAENSNSAAIQAIIDKASALKGKRAVVHFPMGTYNIDQTIEIPAGSDIQLIGDGILYASVFKNAGKSQSEFNFFKINGPSYITIKDLQIGEDAAANKSNAFSFSNIDQPGSRVKLDQLYSLATTSMFINRLDYTYFEKNNSFFSRGNTIIGGDKVKTGTGTSKLYCFGGQSAGVHLENNATMLARDCWWEGSYKKDFIPLNLTGDGNLTVDGAMYAPTDLDSGTIINVSKFAGRLALLNMYLAGGINVQPNSPDLKMLVWNINNYYKKDPSSFLRQKMASKIAMIGITTQCFNIAGITCATGDPQSVDDISINVPDLNNFINDLTKENRTAMPKPLTNLATGTSNIYLSRVSVLNCAIACLFNK